MATAEIRLDPPIAAAVDSGWNIPPTATISWDEGRVAVNPAYAPFLAAAGLTTLERFRQLTGQSVRAIDSRETARVVVSAGDGPPQAFYIKRYGRPTWRERLVPWLRLSRPILGAGAEWVALDRFRTLGIPTMEGVAYGADAAGSFVMTRELPARCDLKQWVQAAAARAPSPGHWTPADRELLDRFLPELASMVRRLHAAGLHHQDLYLNHVLWCGDQAAGGPDLRLIDLGRVREKRHLGQRWILKDLAQLNYSAAGIPATDRWRFLCLYLGRRPTRADRRLIRLIRWKSARIAEHTRKHQL